ncbi:diguanylate cyclase [Frateuria sp. GZRR35]|uniref:tetratricopeptide repeat-containing diguanylate cyclase n=2 Tax=unclassified Frateuria TaxID=2648894 RepID=UPI003EDC4741
MKTFLLTGLFLLLPALAIAGERVDDVLRDQRLHGYRSVDSAVGRLGKAVDVPGPDAPLTQRWRYQSALLDLAMAGDRVAPIEAAIKSLEAMATNDACTRCRFDALLARANLTVRTTTPAAGQVYLKQAAALLPQLHDDASAPGALLSAQAWNAGVDGRFNVAIEKRLKAYALAAARHDEAEQIRQLAGMTPLNANLGDVRRAVEVGEEAYARANAVNYHAIMGTIALDLGHAYSLLDDRPHQRVALERALALSEHDPGQLDTHILALNNLSDYYLSQPGQNQRVLDYARRADALARDAGSEISRAAPLANIGIALSRQGKVDASVTTLREAIDLSERHANTVYVIGITQELVKVMQSAGRYREALAQLQKANALEADLTRQQREKAVLDLQEKYAAERKSQQIAQLSAQNQIKQAQLAAESWRNRLWIALAAMLALGSVLLMHSIRRTRQANRLLARQSSVDPLTGAFNRRHAQGLLDHLQQPARRRATDTGQEVGTGLLMLDLDFFKHINDTWGHAAGDAVLVAVAQRLRGLLRHGDAIVRWGGEEFVLILHNTPASALPALARHVLHAIGDAPVRFADQPVPVTVSIGAVNFPARPGQGWEAALALADLALYQAKAGGRNQAFCLTRVSADADSARLARDLARASAAGDVDLEVIAGPVRVLPAIGEERVALSA